MMYLKITNHNQIKKYKFQQVDWALQFIQKLGMIKNIVLTDYHPHDGNYYQIYPMQINDNSFIRAVNTWMK